MVVASCAVGWCHACRVSGATVAEAAAAMVSWERLPVVVVVVVVVVPRTMESSVCVTGRISTEVLERRIDLLASHGMPPSAWRIVVDEGELSCRSSIPDDPSGHRMDDTSISSFFSASTTTEEERAGIGGNPIDTEAAEGGSSDTSSVAVEKEKCDADEG